MIPQKNVKDLLVRIALMEILILLNLHLIIMKIKKKKIVI